MPTDLTFWAQTFFNCLGLGSLLLLIAIGLNIIYGINRIVNLAHGSLYALGAYFGYTLVAKGLNFFLALVLAPILVFGIGLILERSIIAPIRTRPMLYTLILTYGVSVLLDGLTKYFWGVQPRFISTPSFLSQTIHLGSIPYPFYRFFILIVTAAVMASLMFLLGKTKLGITMRAASHIPGDGFGTGHQYEHGSCVGIRDGLFFGWNRRGHRGAASNRLSDDGKRDADQLLHCIGH